MMSKIQIGDTVIVYRKDEDGDLYGKKAKILNLPAGQGDTIQVEYENGDVDVLNPYGRDCDSLLKMKTATPQKG